MAAATVQAPSGRSPLKLARPLLSRLGGTPEKKERSVHLRVLAFLGAAIALSALALFTGDYLRAGLLLAATAGGHLFSWRREGRVSRLRELAMYIAFGVALYPLRGELLGLFTWGTLLPLARFLATGVAISSFALRTRRILYNNLELSLVALLLVGEEALSLTYLGFLLLFAMIALLFLAISHLPRDVESAAQMALPGTGPLLGIGAAIAGVTAAVTVATYIVLPQSHAVTNAGPLPSRVDLTSGWPTPPTDLSPGDWTPWADFLPSRGEELRLGPRDDGDAFDLAKYTDLGYTGSGGGDVVMHVRSPLASFWRGFTLDGYDGHGWVSATSAVRLAVDPSGRLMFLEAPSAMRRDRAYVQSYFLKVSQPNALFTAYNPGWIALGAGGSTGRLQLAQGNLEYLRQLDSYRVLSPVPRLSPVSLRGDVVDTSDGAFLTQPRVPERVRLLTEQIIEGAVTDYDKAARIERFLLESYPYDLTVSPYREDEDSVDRFLFVDQAGYCSQFATAMAVMGRLAGLPTRVAVGYLPGKYNSLTGTHAVWVQDAHAWVEVRFKRFGWVPFDPTPHPDSPWALGKGSSSLARGIQQTLRSAIGGFTIDAPSAAAATLGSVLGGLPNVAAVALMIGVVIGLLLLPLRWLRGRVGGSGRDGTPAYSAIPGRGREEMRRGIGSS